MQRKPSGPRRQARKALVTCPPPTGRPEPRGRLVMPTGNGGFLPDPHATGCGKANRLPSSLPPGVVPMEEAAGSQSRSGAAWLPRNQGPQCRRPGLQRGSVARLVPEWPPRAAADDRAGEPGRGASTGLTGRGARGPAGHAAPAFSRRVWRSACGQACCCPHRELGGQVGALACLPPHSCPMEPANGARPASSSTEQTGKQGTPA